MTKTGFVNLRVAADDAGKLHLIQFRAECCRKACQSNRSFRVGVRHFVAAAENSRR
jgi:hypothetical protein